MFNFIFLINEISLTKLQMWHNMLKSRLLVINNQNYQGFCKTSTAFKSFIKAIMDSYSI